MADEKSFKPAEVDFARIDSGDDFPALKRPLVHRISLIIRARCRLCRRIRLKSGLGVGIIPGKMLLSGSKIR